MSARPGINATSETWFANSNAFNNVCLVITFCFCNFWKRKLKCDHADMKLRTFTKNLLKVVPRQGRCGCRCAEHPHGFLESPRMTERPRFATYYSMKMFLPDHHFFREKDFCWSKDLSQVGIFKLKNGTLPQ